jgi:hypothetical protein
VCIKPTSTLSLWDRKVIHQQWRQNVEEIKLSYKNHNNQQNRQLKSHSPYGPDDFLPWIRGSDRVRDTNKELMAPVSEFHLFVYGSSDG